MNGKWLLSLAVMTRMVISGSVLTLQLATRLNRRVFFIMRKIESEMVAAVWNHHEWKKANTRVEIKGPHAMVFLHGNHIATLNRFDKCLEFYGGSDDRWFSRTTFSRLNALALQFCGFRPFYTKRHVPMIRRRRDDSTGDREWTLRDFYSFNACSC